MGSMFCPRCGTPRMMDRSTSEQETTGPGGETIRLLIETYHCSICHSFVRSESVHEHDNDAPTLPTQKGSGTQPQTRNIHG